MNDIRYYSATSSSCSQILQPTGVHASLMHSQPGGSDAIARSAGRRGGGRATAAAGLPSGAAHKQCVHYTTLHNLV